MIEGLHIRIRNGWYSFNTNHHRKVLKICIVVLSLSLSSLAAMLAYNIQGLQHVIGKSASNIGEQHLLVIPVYFPDVFPSTTIEEIHELMVNVDHYVRELTYQKSWIVSEVLDWTLLDNSLQFYGVDGVVSLEEHEDSFNIVKMVKEAVDKVDGIIDFSYYDRLLIYHSGYGRQSYGAAGESARYNWPSTCHILVHHLTNDLTVVESASIVAELAEDNPSYGAIVHELGHGFGADDLYNKKITYGEDIEYWGLMSAGDHLDDSQQPCHMCLYTKLDVGYIESHQLMPITNGTYTFEIIAMSIDSDGFYGAKYVLPDGRYYLVEARMQINHDSGLTRSGVLVMIVDPAKGTQYGGVLLAPDSRFPISECAYGPGEFFFDKETEFGIYVINETSAGYFVTISTKSIVDWKRKASLDYNQLTQETLESGSITTLPNGTMYMSVDGINEDTNNKSICVFRSDDHGTSWNLVYVTQNDFDRFNGVVVTRKETSFVNLTQTIEYVPYLFCEYTGSVNHSIEAWDINTNTSTTLTDRNMDARNPSVTSSEDLFFLTFEVLNGTPFSWQSSVMYPAISMRSASSPFSLTYDTYPLISNATQPILSTPHYYDYGVHRPFLAYVNTTDIDLQQILLRSWYGWTHSVIYSTEGNITNLVVATNPDENMTMVAFEEVTQDSAYPLGHYICANISEDYTVTVIDRRVVEAVAALHGAPRVSWIHTPTGETGFFVMYNNGTTCGLFYNENDLSLTDFDNPLLIGSYIFTTHEKAKRWTSPLYILIYGYWISIYEYSLVPKAFHDYYPEYFEPQVQSTGVPTILLPLIAFLISCILLVSVQRLAPSEQKMDIGYWKRERRRLVIFLLMVVSVITLNYLLSAFLSASVMHIVNFVAAGIIPLYIGILQWRYFFPSEGNDNDPEE